MTIQEDAADYRAGVGRERKAWFDFCMASLCAPYHANSFLQKAGAPSLHVRRCTHEWCDAILDVMDRALDVHAAYR